MLSSESGRMDSGDTTRLQSVSEMTRFDEATSPQTTEAFHETHGWSELPSYLWNDVWLLALDATELCAGILFTILAYEFGGYMNQWPRVHTWDEAWARPFYTDMMFNGAMLYVFLLPLGFVLSADAVGRLSTHRAVPKKIRALTLLGLGSATLALTFWNFWNWHGNRFFKMDKDAKFNALKNQLSFTIFVLWLPIGFLLLAMSARLFWSLIPQRDSSKATGLLNEAGYNELASEETAAPMSESVSPISDRYGDLCLLVFLFIVIPGCWLASTILWSDWTYLTVPDIVERARKRVKDLSYGSKMYSNNLKIAGTGVYMHLYPDVYVFYITLFVIFLVGLIGNFNPRFRHIMKKLIFFRRIPKIPLLNWDFVALRFGEVILIVLVTWIFGFVFYFMNYRHSYEPSEGIARKEQKFGRTIGILSNIACGLLMFPISRCNSILTRCFAISFESGVKFHRWLGTLWITFSTLHIVLMLVYLYGEKIPYEQYPPSPTYSPKVKKHRVLEVYYPFSDVPWTKWHTDNFSIPMMYYVVIFCGIPFVLSASLDLVRRRFWEVFYFIHIYGALVLIVSIMFHASNAWYFMLPGMIVQWYERLHRLWAASAETQVVVLEKVSPEITKVEISRNTRYPVTPLGAYCWLNIPHISPFEWHPFSVANQVNSPRMQFFIKSMGLQVAARKCPHWLTTSWSHKLGELARLSRSVQPYATISVEGPYGYDLDYKSYRSIVLVAGGIGVTPTHSIVKSLYNESLRSPIDMPDIHFVWTVRRAETFRIFRESLREMRERPVENVHLHLYASREVESGNHWTKGRPDLRHLLGMVGDMSERALIFACGPAVMVTQCMEIAYRQGNSFHSETFLF